MSYKVQFVGLAWFHEDPPGSVRVLLPDGRNFGNNIPAHTFSISVAPDRIVGAPTGWSPGEIEEDPSQMQFWPPPSKIALSGTETAGPIDRAEQLERLPSLRAIVPGVKVDPDKAKRVGDFDIRQGTFKVFRTETIQPDDAAVLSTMELQHDGNITITLTSIADPSDPNAPVGIVRTITLKPETEVAIVNTSRGEPVPADPDNHSMIYSQLCSEAVIVILPVVDASDLPPLVSTHPFFQTPVAALNGPGCSNVRM